MALPTNADVIVVHGYWLDELTGLGVKQSNGRPATIMFDPVPLLGANATKTPNLRDLTSNAHLKTRTRVATVDPETGYYATLLVASNDPDLDAYGGRKVTLLGEDPFIIEVPYNAPTVTVDAAMAAKTGLPLNSSTKAIWLTNATVIGTPPPQPTNSYLTSTQTLANIAAGIETHDEDPDAHADIRALIGTPYTTEQAQDAAAALFSTQTGKVSATYDDAGNHIALDVTGLTKADVGLNNVNNTADANKPVSTAQQAAIDAVVAAVPEAARDALGAALVAGANITITPDDAGDTITISASGGGSSYSDEQAQDAIAALLAAGTHSGISFAYNDAGNAISATVTGASSLFTQSATKTANYTAADSEIVPLDTSGGTFTLTGPTSGKPFGYRWKTGTAAPTIAAPSGYTINGVATVTAGLLPSATSGELVLWQAFGTDYQPIGGFKGQSQLDGRYPVLDGSSKVPAANMRPFVDRGPVAANTTYNPWDVVSYSNRRVLITNQNTTSTSKFISASNFTPLSYVGWVDIREYGAVVDGTTDDTAAIQAAINSFGTNSNTSTPGTGGTVYFPPGLTRTSATLDLPSNVHLKGAGFSASCIQLLPDSNCHMITTHRSTGSGNPNAFWSSIRDLMLDGRKDNQGAVLSDCTLTPESTAVTSAAGTFAANGTLIQGVGILPGTTIASGGGTGAITLSQATTYSALAQAPGSSKVYQGGTTNRTGTVIPWCAIYHETNPYSTGQTGDPQFDPTHLFANLRIYYMCGDGVRVQGRSDNTLENIKVSFAVGNGFTIDFDTKVKGCITEAATGHGIQVPGHSSDQITNSKFYNNWGYGVYLSSGCSELTFANIDIQQNTLSSLRIESSNTVIFNGSLSQTGFPNGGSSQTVPSPVTWTASKVCSNLRSASALTVVTPTVSNGFMYACYVAGTTGSTEPTWPTTAGQTVVDGTVTWVCLSGLPAAVSLSAATSCVIDVAINKGLNGLRIVNSSSKNDLRLANTTTVTNAVDVTSDSQTITGTTNRLVINGSPVNPVPELAVNRGIANGYAPLDSTGLVPTSYLPASSGGAVLAFGNGFFGDGSDGTATLDGTVTVSWATKVGSSYNVAQNVNLDTLVVSSGVTVVTKSFIINVKTSLSGSGTISYSGSNATSSAAGSAAVANFLRAGAAAGAGGATTGTAGTNQTSQVTHGGAGGAGGAGTSAGGAGGTVVAPSTSTGGLAAARALPYAAQGHSPANTVNTPMYGGAGGGGGGGDGTNSGGGGGGGGGVVIVNARTVAAGLTFAAIGGNGFTPTTGNCGGGGGGGGGLVIVNTTSITGGSTPTLTAAGGSAGSGVGTGTAGSAGSAGHTYLNVFA